MYVLTSSGVTGLAVDRVEQKGIEHFIHTRFPEGTECWTFSESDYEKMGSPHFKAIKPDSAPNYVSIGKAAWKEQHPELFDDYVPQVKTIIEEDTDGGQG